MSASAGWQNWSSGCSPGGAATFARGTGGGLPSLVSGTAAYLTGAPSGWAGPPVAPSVWARPAAASAGWAEPAASTGWAWSAASSGWAGSAASADWAESAAFAGWAGSAAAPLTARPERSRDTPALAVSSHRASAAIANLAPFAPRFPAVQVRCCRDYGPILMPGASRRGDVRALPHMCPERRIVDTATGGRCGPRCLNPAPTYHGSWSCEPGRNGRDHGQDP
jgi:hypothetical protein